MLLREEESTVVACRKDVDIVRKCPSSPYLPHCGDGGFPILYVSRVSNNEELLMSIL